MANRRFEMHQYRHILSRMRLGETDRHLAKAGLIGRRKAAQLRLVFAGQGWLDPAQTLPDDAAMVAPPRCVSWCPWRPSTSERASMDWRGFAATRSHRAKALRDAIQMCDALSRNLPAAGQGVRIA